MKAVILFYNSSPINGLPRQTLARIIAEHGRGICDAPKRIEALLRDLCGAHRLEINIIIGALEERVAADMIAAGNSAVPRGVLLARRAARLHDEVAMEESAARWAVHTWALALGVITPDELDTLERAPRAAAAPQSAPHANPAVATHANPARTTLVVALDGSGDFLTLTDAIRHAQAGSRLLVRPGVYDEGLIIDKPLEIVGDGAREEIIVRATASNCLALRTDSATIRGLTLRGQSRAGGGNVRLSGCRIHDGQSHGVFVRDAGRALLESCDVFRNRGAGVQVDAGGVAVARACRVNGNGHVGFSCEAGGAVEVEGCDLTQNRVAAWGTDYGSLVKSRNNLL